LIAGVVSFDGIAPDVLAAASIRGTRAHGWTEWFDEDEHPDSMPSMDGIEGYCEAYVEFLSDSGFVCKSKEQVVVSKRYRYAGTYDRFGMLDGRPTVLDIKCVAAMSSATGMQTAGYALALSPIASHQEFDRVAIRLRPDGKYRLHRYTDPQDYHNWLACVRITHWKLAHGMAQLEN